MPPVSASKNKNPSKRSRGRPPLTSEDLSARRDSIIEIATRKFITNGFAATTLEDITAEAHVTKRTIYELVGDKQALFTAACNTLRAETPGFKFSVIMEGRPVSNVLREMARQLIDHSLRRDMIMLERAVIIEAARDEHLVRDTVTESSQHLFGVISGCFDRLIGEGLLEPIDTLIAAAIFYDLTVGARGFRAVLGMSPESASDQEIAMRVDVFLNGISRR